MRCLVLSLTVLFAGWMAMGQKAVPSKKPTAQSAKEPSPSAVKPAPEPWPPVTENTALRAASDRLKEEAKRRLAELRAKQEAAIAADPSLAPKKFRPLLGVCAIPLHHVQIGTLESNTPLARPADADPDAIAPAPPDCPTAQ